MRGIKCREIVIFLSFFIISALLVNSVFPFFVFIKTLILSIDILIWPIFFAIVIYAARDLLRTDKKDEGFNLRPDNVQAQKVLELYQSKCKGRKALMITAPWGS